MRQIKVGVANFGDVLRERAEIFRASSVVTHLATSRAFTVLPTRKASNGLGWQACRPRGVPELVAKAVHGGFAVIAKSNLRDANEAL